MGMRFSSTSSAPSSTRPERARSSSAARTIRLVPSVGSSGWSQRRLIWPSALGRNQRRSARSIDCMTIASSWKPSGRSPNTSRCRLILAGARTQRSAMGIDLGGRFARLIQAARQHHPGPRRDLLGPLEHADARRGRKGS